MSSIPPKNSTDSNKEKKKAHARYSAEQRGLTSMLSDSLPTRAKKKREITLTEVVRSEVNLLIFPFFTLWSKDIYTKGKTEYRAVVRRENHKLEVYWKVSANPEYGYPGPFDREVHKVIEQIIEEAGFPVHNPICIGSFHNICKRIGIKKGGSREYKAIKEALVRLKTTTIHSKGTFFSKEKEEWIEDIFELYERVIFKGEKFPDGKIADTNYIFLNSWYLSNINARYVKPIDWNYYKSLETPIASRLYELLSVKFYGLGRKKKFIRYKYSTLCDLLPVAQQKYLSLARKILDSAHKKLKETEFLADYSWENIPLTKPDQKEKDWYILYYPGRKAKEEIEKFRAFQTETERERLEPLPLPASESRKPWKIKPKAAPTQSQEKLIGKLKNFGISGVVAKELVKQSNPQTIEKWTEAIQYKSDIEDKAAYLVKAIKENWQIPESFLREEEARKEEERRLEILREMEARQAERNKAKLISSSPEYDEIWQKVRSLLRQEMSHANFETWIKNTSLLDVESGIAFIGVPSEFVKDWLSKRMKALMEKNLIQVLGQEVDLEFVVKDEG